MINSAISHSVIEVPNKHLVLDISDSRLWIGQSGVVHDTQINGKLHPQGHGEHFSPSQCLFFFYIIITTR